LWQDDRRALSRASLQADGGRKSWYYAAPKRDGRTLAPGSENEAQEENIVNLSDLTGRHLKPYRREVRMIFQDPYSSLNPRMTVL